MEFTGFPDHRVPERRRTPRFPPPCWPRRNRAEPPTVDVTMRLQEGKQYLVNRITFVGNTTTRDNVIRREMRLVEGSVFNTEALKYSVRRLNQLGYFEQINEQDQKATKVDKTPGRDGTVDVTLNLKEQNRNQLTFGAGVSQYEGVFGQLGVPDRRTSSAEAKASRCRCRQAIAPRTTSSRSPSRSCSTATSPAASISTSARCSTSATTRRNPRAAT